MPIDSNMLVKALVADRARVLAYIYSIVRDEHVAEDVYQEVCALAIEKRQAIADGEHLAKWVRVTARHRALKAAERTRRGPAVVDDHTLDLLDAHWDSLDALEPGEMLDALRTCMDELSPYTRELIRLRYAEGISGDRLADRVDRKLNTVYVALTRAHRTLGSCIRRKLAGPASEGGPA